MVMVMVMVKWSVLSVREMIVFMEMVRVMAGVMAMMSVILFRRKTLWTS